MKQIPSGSLFGKGLRHIQHLSDYTDEQSHHEASTEKTNDQLDYLLSQQSSQFEDIDSEFQQLNSSCMKRQLQKASLDNLRLFLEKEFDLKKYEHQEVTTEWEGIDKLVWLLDQQREIYQAIHISIEELIVIELFSKSLPKRNSSNFIPRRNRAILDSILHKISLFRSDHQIQGFQPLSNKLLGQLRLEFFPKNSLLFSHGDAGTTFYIIIRGSAYCLLEDQRHYSLSNQIFGGQERSVDQSEENTQTRIIQHNELNFTNSISHSLPGNKPAAVSSVSSFEAEQDALKATFPTQSMVRILKPGDSFGEIALLTEQTRTATVVLREDTHLLVLSKEAYSEILGEQERKILRDRWNYLRDFECFRDYDLSQLLQLLHCMERQVLSHKNVIFREGEPSDKVYFLKNGEVKLTKKTPIKQQNQDITDWNYHMSLSQSSRRVQLVILSSPACFGDENLFVGSQQLRAQSAVVSSASAEILSIDQAVFKDELSKHRYLETYEQQINAKIALRNKQAHAFAEIHENSPKRRKSQSRKQSESTPKQHERSLQSASETPQISPQSSRRQIAQELQQASRSSISEKSIHFQQEIMKKSTSRFLNSNSNIQTNSNDSGSKHIDKKQPLDPFCQSPNKASKAFLSANTSFTGISLISQESEPIPLARSPSNQNLETIRDKSSSARLSKFHKLPRLDLSKIDCQNSYFPGSSQFSQRISDKSEDQLEQLQQKQQNLQPSRSQDHRETYFPRHGSLEQQISQVTPCSALKLQRILKKYETNENPYFCRENKLQSSQVAASFGQSRKNSLQPKEAISRSNSNGNNSSLERKLMQEKDKTPKRILVPTIPNNKSGASSCKVLRSSHENDPVLQQTQQTRQSSKGVNLFDSNQPLSPAQPKKKHQLSAAQIIKIHKALLLNIRGGPELLATLSYREQLKNHQFLREQLDAWGMYEIGMNNNTCSDSTTLMKETEKICGSVQDSCDVQHAEKEKKKNIPQCNNNNNNNNNTSIYALSNDSRNLSKGQFRFFHGEKQHYLKLANWKKSQEQLFKPTKIKKLIGNLEIKRLSAGKSGLKIPQQQQVPLYSSSKISSVLQAEEQEPR